MFATRRAAGWDWEGRAELEVIRDIEVEPELAGMTLQGITNATEIFDEINIKVKKPKQDYSALAF